MSVEFCLKNLSDVPVQGDFSYFKIFLPLIMKNIFEKLALYRGCGADTLLIIDLPKVFLKN